MVTRWPHEQTDRGHPIREDKGKRSKDEGVRRRKRRITRKSHQWEKEKKGNHVVCVAQGDRYLHAGIATPHYTSPVQRLQTHSYVTFV